MQRQFGKPFLAQLENRPLFAWVAIGLMAAIGIADVVWAGVPLGPLYVIPVIVGAMALPRAALLGLAVAAALLRETAGAIPWEPGATARIVVAIGVFALSGLVVSELTRNLRLTRRHLDQLEAAEEEARQLVGSSPGAMMTIETDGRILLANQAARQLLGFDGEGPSTRTVTRYLPMLAPLVNSRRAMPLLRTMVEGIARRESGEAFFAQMWLSNYQSQNGTRIAVVFSDTTEIFRDREELGLRQLLMSSRLATAAVSHEVRNLCNSAYRLLRKMGAEAGLEARDDYQTLGSLLDGMRKLTADELKSTVEEVNAGADLSLVLQELHLILEPGLREAGIRLIWDVAADLPLVRADHSGLLQVLLNLAQNAQRALEEVEEKHFAIAAYQMDRSVVVRVHNNGEPLSAGDRLFEPLQPKATATGLGLFISRAILRTYGGDLRYTPQSQGCTFLITLPIAGHLRESARG